MKKSYSSIYDIRSNNNLNPKGTVVVFAGIVFTLFAINDYTSSDGFIIQPSNNSINIVTSDYRSNVSNSIITLKSNESTTEEKIAQAYYQFCAKNNIGDLFDPVFHFILEGISKVSAEKVAVDGDIEEGLLNVSLKMADGAILSINKRIEYIDSPIVAFNIFKDRKLLISDIMDLNLLTNYILNVQNKIG